jgi:hypothetical protein
MISRKGFELNSFSIYFRKKERMLWTIRGNLG